MSTFIPRHISQDQATLGYNNEGRGELLGYIAVPSQHEQTCRYRISTGGDPDKNPHEACSCRIGLWRDTTVTQKVVNEMRKTMKRSKKKAPAKSKKAARPRKRGKQ